ncbi:glycosyl transferase family protein [Sphingomonas sp. KR1UV-12]|uniref:Glycosyl transferase family protein n=1 Tax=Sphingomonas aurea TaxID=3063994 RepID=A0ABT9EP97_9SPHN|nr:glycosyl transferase family protein [Sphingomonas sp. KR1UV-12]MDP1028603.1 glycosyl transferase family protein [Sphingomonas sp. KR1UV-12]
MDTIDLLVREAMLFAAVGLLVGGIDDLAVDLLYWLRRIWRCRRPAATVAGLPVPGRPGRLFVFVPAWDEEPVIAAMLATALARYDHPDFAIHVGLYPNDAATIAAARTVADRDRRVRLVIGPRPGPTTKADCLNSLWRDLMSLDRPAKAVILHDAEDVVHPDELRVFDSLIERHGVVQLPVLPLIAPGSIVGAHYADDFAQAHANHLAVRTALGAGMPLAGTGCAIAVETLAGLAAGNGGDPFDPDSLVEDYELGLRIAALGHGAIFARLLDADGEIVAVRAYFPDTLAAAVKQKARWITGIALAGWDRTGWGRPLAIMEHWWRARDRRTPLAMLLLLVAYLAVPAWLASAVGHWWTGTPVAPLPPLLRTLLAINAGLLAWRIAMRAIFTAQAYGWRQGFWSVPRLLVGNLVAMLAAARAIRRYVAMMRGRPLAWEKTAHVFPDAPA